MGGRVGLGRACAGLAIGEYGAVDAIEDGTDSGLRLGKDVRLGALGRENLTRGRERMKHKGTRNRVYGGSGGRRERE